MRPFALPTGVYAQSPAGARAGALGTGTIAFRSLAFDANTSSKQIRCERRAWSRSKLECDKLMQNRDLGALGAPNGAEVDAPLEYRARAIV